MDGCEGRCAALRREKTQAVKAAGGAGAEQILRMEEREAYLEGQGRELGESAVARALCPAADASPSSRSWLSK